MQVNNHVNKVVEINMLQDPYSMHIKVYSRHLDKCQHKDSQWSKLKTPHSTVFLKSVNTTKILWKGFGNNPTIINCADNDTKFCTYFPYIEL